MEVTGYLTRVDLANAVLAVVLFEGVAERHGQLPQRLVLQTVHLTVSSAASVIFSARQASCTSRFPENLEPTSK